MKLRLTTATATPPAARSRIAMVMVGCASPSWLSQLMIAFGIEDVAGRLKVSREQGSWK